MAEDKNMKAVGSTEKSMERVPITIEMETGILATG